MSIIVKNKLGEITINKEIVAMIAGASAVECYGLVGMATKSTTNGIAKLLKGEQISKGVEIVIEDEEIIIDLYVIVQFGTKISVVAQNIIDKVKYNVETQTGLKVKKVNLNIEGVKIQA